MVTRGVAHIVQCVRSSARRDPPLPRLSLNVLTFFGVYYIKSSEFIVRLPGNITVINDNVVVAPVIKPEPQALSRETRGVSSRTAVSGFLHSKCHGGHWCHMSKMIPACKNVTVASLYVYLMVHSSKATYF